MEESQFIPAADILKNPIQNQLFRRICCNVFCLLWRKINESLFYPAIEKNNNRNSFFHINSIIFVLKRKNYE